jgi:GxxExxY protein
MNENEIGTIIIETAIDIHRKLGPGLLESVYEVILAHELEKRGLKTERQVRIPIQFEGISFDEGFRADLIVTEKVIVEPKSKQDISASDRKQIQTHLCLTGLKLGYLLNFGADLMKHGIVRAVNGLKEN